MQPLALLKALGDNTRYAIYLEIARSSAPLSTSDIAESLGLHPNTVRPHLERMREVGLLDVVVDARGAVGRPQHRYLMAADAPSLGLEPPAFPLLAAMLAKVAAQAGPDGDDVAETGRGQGRSAAQRSLYEQRSPERRPTDIPLPRTDTRACANALVSELATLGFDPTTSASPTDGELPLTVAFAHCPYRELAEAYPQLVCSLHRGIVEGFVEEYADTGRSLGERDWLVVDDFHTLADREPCQVSLASYAGEQS